MREEARKAINKAKEEARSLYEEDELEGLRLEEIKPSHDGQKWLVTLGWIEKGIRTVSSGIGPARNAKIERLPRVYKVFHVNAENFEIEEIENKNNE